MLFDVEQNLLPCLPPRSRHEIGAIICPIVCFLLVY
jgi:hypothetical protein